jgi:Transposase DDE domain group 1
MVLAEAMRGKTRGRIQIGADDPSLTAAGGMLAVTELCGKLGLIEALDEGMGPVKQRRRGFTGGQVLAGMAAAQLAGEDFLVGLDRVRADQAGQLVTPVPGLATSTATGIARRFTAEHWRGVEAGLARATARMLGLLPAERAAELAGGPVTIDIDATDVEVYGSKKRGVAYTYQGQRAGRPHVASWAETEIPLAAGLLSGDQDPRSDVAGLLGRALAALPQAIRDGAAAAGRKIALRADAGYFAGELARAAAKEDMAFAIGAKRISSMWKALAAVPDDAWRDATDMQGAQVAVSPYKPTDWPEETVLLIRRVKLDPDQVSADPRSRRRRTLHPDQRALPIPELEQEPAIYAPGSPGALLHRGPLRTVHARSRAHGPSKPQRAVQHRLEDPAPQPPCLHRRSSGPFTEVFNLPFGSGICSRFASKAHLPTSAPLRARAPGSLSGQLYGHLPGGDPALRHSLSCCLSAAGIRFLGTLSRQGLPPLLRSAYRPACAYPRLHGGP